MDKFKSLKEIVVPLDRPNVDTDALIPKQFLKSIKRSGFGPNLFDDWRYLDPGGPEVDNESRRLNPEFVLNEPRYRHAAILLARDNFGCGSSREHAVWALIDHGFRVIIAPGFADIFHNNSFKNGLLPIVLPSERVNHLFLEVEATPGYRLGVNLENQSVLLPSGETYSFEIDPFRKERLLKGLDDIGLTLKRESLISRFELRQSHDQPWLQEYN